MRFMVIVKASKDSEAGVMPSQKLLEEMGKFNEDLAKAGVLLAGEGLQASAKGARVKFSGAKRTVIDDMFWGDRYGKLEDPFGHHWSVATHIRDMTPDEVAQAAKQFGS